MLPKRQRIKKVAFGEILTRSAFGASPLFSIRFVKSPESSDPASKSTFAVVVSKKVLKAAADRNKIKRRCYHVLRELAPKIKNPYRIVLFVKKGVDKLSFIELTENIQSILSKNNLIN
jgi:ribonuclease P protein component